MALGLQAPASVVPGLSQAPHKVLVALRIRLLDTLVRNKGPPPNHDSLSSYLVRLARLGGDLARTQDPQPGNTVVWRGMSRLTDIAIGFTLGAQLVGNWKDGLPLTIERLFNSTAQARGRWLPCVQRRETRRRAGEPRGHTGSKVPPPRKAHRPMSVIGRCFG